MPLGQCDHTNRKKELMDHDSKGGRWVSTERDGLYPISETPEMTIQDVYDGNWFWEDEPFQKSL